MVAAAGLVAAMSGPANADYISTFQGNDCAGVFGTPPACTVEGSPLIIKLNFSGSVVSEIEFGAFPSITGDEFTFDFGDNGTGDGIWFYTPGPGDPAITYYVAKGGPSFNLFSNPGAPSPTSNAFFTPNTPGGGPAGLSHISFYDNGEDIVVPEPGVMLMLGVGLLTAGARLRRRVSR
jgi:hypothetical protein